MDFRYVCRWIGLKPLMQELDSRAEVNAFFCHKIETFIGGIGLSNVYFVLRSVLSGVSPLCGFCYTKIPNAALRHDRAIISKMIQVSFTFFLSRIRTSAVTKTGRNDGRIPSRTS